MTTVRPSARGTRLQPRTAIRPDAVCGYGSHYDVWTVTSGRVEPRVVIDMASDDVDAYLDGAPQSGAPVATDDDGASGSNARVEFQAVYAGDYLVIATSYKPGQTGGYPVHGVSAPQQLAHARGTCLLLGGERTTGRSVMKSIKAVRLLAVVVLLSMSAVACIPEGGGSWLDADWGAFTAITSALITIIGGLIGLFLKGNAKKQAELEKARLDHQDKLEEARIAREKDLEKDRAAREKDTQERRDRLQAFDGYRRELLRFSDEVIDVMGETQTLIAFNPDRADVPANARQRFVEERSKLIGRVSSLVDRGRFFFPNVARMGTGEDMGLAQQGLRDPVLNRVLAALHVLMAIDYEEGDHNRPWIRWETLINVRPGTEGHVCSAFQHLSQEEQNRLLDKLQQQADLRLMDLVVSAKRAFVSEVFSIVQPTQWLDEVEGSYGIKLRARKPEVPAVHVGLK